MEETLSINTRSLKKYGSTTSRTNTINETYVSHRVNQSDTLQGIALRYGVTMEQIRRANRLWATDSLFLRESLLIPVTNTVLSISDNLIGNSNHSNVNNVNSNVSNTITNDEQSTSQIINDASSMINKRAKRQQDEQQQQHRASTSSSTTSPLRDDDYDNENLSDFLIKIDASIASTKEDVKKIQVNSNFLRNIDGDSSSCDSNNAENNRRKPIVSRMKKKYVNNNVSGGGGGGGGINDMSYQQQQQQVTVTTQQNSQVVRTSLMKNERLNEDLFEL